MILKDGDIIGIDVGAVKDGYYADAARTSCGRFRRGALLEVTSEALRRRIAAATPGRRVGDISSHRLLCTGTGYYVADNLTGHGVGQLHEELKSPIPAARQGLQSGNDLAIDLWSISAPTALKKKVGSFSPPTEASRRV